MKQPKLVALFGSAALLLSVLGAAGVAYASSTAPAAYVNKGALCDNNGAGKPCVKPDPFKRNFIFDVTTSSIQNEPNVRYWQGEGYCGSDKVTSTCPFKYHNLDADTRRASNVIEEIGYTRGGFLGIGRKSLCLGLYQGWYAIATQNCYFGSGSGAGDDRATEYLYLPNGAHNLGLHSPAIINVAATNRGNGRTVYFLCVKLTGEKSLTLSKHYNKTKCNLQPGTVG